MIFQHWPVNAVTHQYPELFPCRENLTALRVRRPGTGMLRCDNAAQIK